MKAENTRPTTVPQEAIWNPSQNEWEIGVKNEQGRHIGEWKWWLAPNGHLCCHTFFDDNGNILSYKRFHPNGEVSRTGTYENGVAIEDVYFKSSEPTKEVFAYGNTDDKVFKAVKRSGVPVSFDYYDKEGNHLNPEIEQQELISEEEATISEIEIATIKAKLIEKGKRFLSQEFDSDFYLETILPMIENEEQKRMFDNIVRGALGNKQDFIFHDGDLHLSNLHCLAEMEVGVIVVKGNLLVDGSISLTDDLMEMLLVTGDVEAQNLTTSGTFIVFKDLTVSNCIIGDYNHGSTFVGGDLKAKFFYPEEYFFEVLGQVDFTYAFGNAWRLNQNQNPEAFNFNEKKLSNFISLLHEAIINKAGFEQNKSLLDDNCSDEGLFEFIDRHEFMTYVTMNKPVFKD